MSDYCKSLCSGYDERNKNKKDMETNRKRTIWSNCEPYNQKIVQEFVRCYPNTDIIRTSSEEITFIDEDGMLYLNEKPLIGLISHYYGNQDGDVKKVIDEIIRLNYVKQLLYSYDIFEETLHLCPQFDHNQLHLSECEGGYNHFKSKILQLTKKHPSMKIEVVYVDDFFELGQPAIWAYKLKHSEKADVK
jgi:hypothetical protein